MAFQESEQYMQHIYNNNIILVKFTAQSYTENLLVQHYPKRYNSHKNVENQGIERRLIHDEKI